MTVSNTIVSSLIPVGLGTLSFLLQGIYFSQLFSKSLGYSNYSSRNKCAFVLLCEVRLITSVFYSHFPYLILVVQKHGCLPNMASWVPWNPVAMFMVPVLTILDVYHRAPKRKRFWKIFSPLTCIFIGLKQRCVIRRIFRSLPI